MGALCQRLQLAGKDARAVAFLEQAQLAPRLLVEPGKHDERVEELHLGSVLTAANAAMGNRDEPYTEAEADTICEKLQRENRIMYGADEGMIYLLDGEGSNE